MAATVTSIEELILSAYAACGNNSRTLRRHTVDAVRAVRRGTVYDVWKCLMIIWRIEEKSSNLAHWEEALRAVGAMVYFMSIRPQIR